jgi:hypothetical protein
MGLFRYELYISIYINKYILICDDNSKEGFTDSLEYVLSDESRNEGRSELLTVLLSHANGFDGRGIPGREETL